MGVVAAEHQSSSLFRRGVQKGSSIAIGYMPVAFTFGLLAKSSGLNLFETISMSVFVFAGASQYIALTLIAAGIGGFEIILTTFIVNIRHLLMSASISEKSADEPKWKKALYSFFVTDETFTLAAVQKGKIHSSYMIGLGINVWTSWVSFSAIGFLIGSGLPSILQESMGIALYALFIGILVPSARKSMKVISLAAIAAILNSILTFTTGLSTGWTIILSTLVAAVVIEIVWKGEVVDV
ncbi:AzlC family ABC transporter permease [Pseudalkalibacillus berkeleyi]|uniref:AzlC family ABC transporter permease n=1 Tax=Pseudalkalibacillus berkeleyi TaxID=1069813 RepID=A0ABS9GTR9_9BACL|nr:AzlC family ABC transporter permease [Pseudalkalibacillus berkeleyi]MCF6136249.1 AzlC family ABC transporter permease [Pseudalkalibacillus berkeleyi]